MCLLIYQRAGGDAGGNFALAGSQLQAGHISDPSILYIPVPFMGPWYYLWQSWARDNLFSNATTQQRNRAWGPRQNVKVSVSKWSSHSEYTVDILQEPKMLWPKKTWSRCSVPSSYFWVVLRIWIQIKFCRIQNNNSDPENCGIFWPLTSLYSIFHHLLWNSSTLFVYVFFTAYRGVVEFYCFICTVLTVRSAAPQTAPWGRPWAEIRTQGGRY